jgi:hypothetical protein
VPVWRVVKFTNGVFRHEFARDLHGSDYQPISMKPTSTNIYTLYGKISLLWREFYLDTRKLCPLVSQLYWQLRLQGHYPFETGEEGSG